MNLTRRVFELKINKSVVKKNEESYDSNCIAQKQIKGICTEDYECQLSNEYPLLSLL